MPVISVIIPVYNVAPYLRRCLYSVVNQTFNFDYEIICVDDGSTDNSLEILKEYDKNYPGRFKIISQENQGASVARNVALDIVSGKYTMFVDADDFIAQNSMEKLYNFAEKHNSQVVVFDVLIGSQGKKDFTFKTYDKIKKKYGDSTFNADLAEPFVYKEIIVGIWSKFYLSDFIKKIKFSPGVINEDVCHWIDVFTQAERINYYPVPLYFYVDNRNNSVSTYSDRVVFDAFKVFVVCEKLLKERGYFDKFKDNHYTLMASWLIGAAKKIYPEYRKELIERIKNYDMDINYDNILSGDYYLYEKQDIYFVKVVKENDFGKIENFCLANGIWKTPTEIRHGEKNA